MQGHLRITSNVKDIQVGKAQCRYTPQQGWWVGSLLRIKQAGKEHQAEQVDHKDMHVAATQVQPTPAPQQLHQASAALLLLLHRCCCALLLLPTSPCALQPSLQTASQGPGMHSLSSHAQSHHPCRADAASRNAVEISQTDVGLARHQCRFEKWLHQVLGEFPLPRGIPLWFETRLLKHMSFCVRLSSCPASC